MMEKKMRKTNGGDKEKKGAYTIDKERCRHNENREI